MTVKNAVYHFLMTIGKYSNGTPKVNSKSSSQDWKNLESDFRAVGDDIRVAMKKLEQQEKISKEDLEVV